MKDKIIKNRTYLEELWDQLRRWNLTRKDQEDTNRQEDNCNKQ